MPEKFQEIVRGEGFVILDLNTPKPQSSGHQALEQPQTKDKSGDSSSPTPPKMSESWTPEELASIRQAQSNYLAFRQQQQEREQAVQATVTSPINPVSNPTPSTTPTPAIDTCLKNEESNEIKSAAPLNGGSPATDKVNNTATILCQVFVFSAIACAIAYRYFPDAVHNLDVWRNPNAYNSNDVKESSDFLIKTGVFVVCVAIFVVLPTVIVIANLLDIRFSPCLHRIRGAKHNINKCQDCLKEQREYAEKVALTEQQRLEAQWQRQELLKKEEQQRQEKWLADIRQIEYLKSIDPQDFEHLVSDLYVRLGYYVRTTAYSGDNGVDAYAEKDGKLYVLQCKRVKGSVGEPVLRDLFGTMHHENADGSIVVTTGRVSQQAREWVDGKPIEIVEIEELLDLIEQVYPSIGVVPAHFKMTAKTSDYPASSSIRPNCGKRLTRRKGKYGSFTGCSGYPHCGYTRKN